MNLKIAARRLRRRRFVRRTRSRADRAGAIPDAVQAARRYHALAAVTDDFLTRLTSDAQFARFFAGHSTDSLKKIRQLIVDQLCAATGGPCVHTSAAT